MAQRGRKPGFRMSDEHRTKIQNSQILKRLIDHVEGKCDLSSTQVTAGLGLLKKVMPDISENRLADESGGPLQINVVRFADSNPS